MNCQHQIGIAVQGDTIIIQTHIVGTGIVLTTPMDLAAADQHYMALGQVIQKLKMEQSISREIILGNGFNR